MSINSKCETWNEEEKNSKYKQVEMEFSPHILAHCVRCEQSVPIMGIS